ncbi:MAG TPA: type II toxin-antitoxin system ParD family antitoxin [Pirellulaceae bacterium]|nr:type II toxin-antitoxin system ParD family antitoxin [Pirellulaceae bacterium]
METVHVTITGDAAAFIQDQVATGRYGSPAEVVTEAISQAQVHAAKQRLASSQDLCAALSEG